MADQTKILVKQLQEACKISGSRWGIWLKLVKKGWEFRLSHGISKSRQAILAQFIKSRKNATWLAGALSNGRIRSTQTAISADALGCQRIYVFPSNQSRWVLLVGTNKLDRVCEGLFRVLSLQIPSSEADPGESESISQNVESAISRTGPLGHLVLSSNEVDLEASYNPEEIFKNVLDFLAGSLHCDAGIMAIRSGELFRVSALWHLPSGLLGKEISIQDSVILAKMVVNRKGVFQGKGDDWFTSGLIKGKPFSEKFFQAWLGAPIIIGQRVIGLVAFFSSRTGGFTATDLNKVSGQITRLAYVIENAIVFSEAAHYLGQLALLNDLASAASLGINTHEVANRVIQRLRRTFRTEKAGVFLLSVDRKTLKEYGVSEVESDIIPVESSLVGTVVKTGLPVRFGDLINEIELNSYRDIDPGVTSVMVVPLKYRGNVIGILVLESTEEAAFTQRDEQLLVLIASHLAGLFENLRLSDEARERAHNLSLINRQLQAVRETALDIASDMDLDAMFKRVVHRACELIGNRGAELGLIDEGEQIVRVMVSETPWDTFKGTRIPLMAGVSGRVAAFGEPLVISDYNNWSGRLFPERTAPFRSVAGVPLKFKDQVIGTLVVIDDRKDWEFRPEHIQLLELLAPQVAIWIRNARLYQELQERSEAQRIAENRLIRSARLAAVGEMAAGVAHELNNPLTTVGGFVELVINELPVDSPHRSDLELVLREAQRAHGVVRRLLDFSRPVDEHRSQVDINELINDVLGLIHHLLHTGGIELVTNLIVNLPWISADPGQIKQVLLNLFHNAIQSMPNGGLLTVDTVIKQRDGRDWIGIAVRDTGEGISPANLERIFEPFFTTRPPGKGTGLGLSVSYGIITEHGGIIDVESRVGKGSCFTIYLPVESEDTNA